MVMKSAQSIHAGRDLSSKIMRFSKPLNKRECHILERNAPRYYQLVSLSSAIIAVGVCLV